MEAATGDSDGKIADSESVGLFIKVVHLSVKRVKKTVPLDLYFGIYHETFRIRGNRETFFHTETIRDHSIG
jgi:hypothetical protein